MNRSRLTLPWIAASILVLLLGMGMVRPARANPVSVLMYHRFGDGTAISIPMDQFRRQILYLKENGYHFVSLDELRRRLKKGNGFPEKSVMITVDDGYRSTYTRAHPFLKEQGIPWVLYVYTEAVDRGYSSALTWPMIREMAESGVDVENHSYSHGKFITVRNKSPEWIEKELVEPARRLESKTGQSTETFAIPYGMYDRELLSILRDQLSLSIVFGSDPGVVDPARPGPVLNRFGINRSTSWEQFLDKLNRLPLQVDGVEPALGERLDRTPETVRVDLARPERFPRARINVFVSEFGALEWSWVDREQGILEARIPGTMSRMWNRVIVTAYDPEHKRYRYHSQGIVFDPAISSSGGG